MTHVYKLFTWVCSLLPCYSLWHSKAFLCISIHFVNVYHFLSWARIYGKKALLRWDVNSAIFLTAVFARIFYPDIFVVLDIIYKKQNNYLYTSSRVQKKYYILSFSFLFHLLMPMFASDFYLVVLVWITSVQARACTKWAHIRLFVVYCDEKHKPTNVSIIKKQISGYKFEYPSPPPLHYIFKQHAFTKRYECVYFNYINTRIHSIEICVRVCIYHF